MNDNMCPICERILGDQNLSRHHLIPKVKGGKKTEPVLMHLQCHRQIHAVFTESELYKEYNTIEKLIAHPEIIKFIKWIKNKPSDFLVSVKQKRN